MITKNFINLTNGIEFIPQLDNYEFIRIQSTTIEQKNWIRLFSDLDHNFLINLVLGNNCRVYDCGAGRSVSKTIYLGVPMILYMLSKYFKVTVPMPIRFSRDGKETFLETKFYNQIYDDLFVHGSTKEKLHLRKKLGYYKKFLHTDTLHLTGYSMSTKNDSKYDFFSDILKKQQSAENRHIMSI